MATSTRLVCFALLAFALSSCGPGQDKAIALRFDSTTLCLPKAHVQSTTALAWFVSAAAPGLDSSDGGALIVVPSESVHEIFPRYVVSSIGPLGGDVRNDLIGIIYPRSAFTVPGNPLELAAWNLPSSRKDYFSEMDATTGLMRLYEFPVRARWWTLATGLPQGTGSDNPPPGWYVGTCQAVANTFMCRQSVNYEDAVFEYDVSEANIANRVGVAQAVSELLQSWSKNCHES